MSAKIFMTASEVAAELGVSESFAYKVMREMNKELKQKGYFTISGKVDRKYFHEKFYATKLEEK
ncbi:DNA-binding protein [Paenibacillus polygoni]|uniref:DNA-binding protein n=1 Tax=Paenibacillus polygoni TaxID=3050112 RepID=A0ABY8X3W8_9BACL|nr:DNA-binding protein [Paenibacillus polygoni]WIV19728.1 DNA-binding protein [Paenibacillus polygoni]